ncbi:MAG: hypothetical protein ACOVMP_06395 [Chthoniobacterales bacterium]
MTSPTFFQATQSGFNKINVVSMARDTTDHLRAKANRICDHYTDH